MAAMRKLRRGIPICNQRQEWAESSSSRWAAKVLVEPSLTDAARYTKVRFAGNPSNSLTVRRALAFPRRQGEFSVNCGKVTHGFAA